MITRTELIKALDGIASQCMDMIAALKDATPPEASTNTEFCPVHHIPWQESRYGLAHPPAEKGGKWCNKATLEKELASKGKPVR